jgi:AcrR family transcriptional regulator
MRLPHPIAATGPKAKTRQAREQSRQRILDAVAELVRERSYASLTVDEVMARAGIGRTIFYRHFDDLGDIVLRAGREAIEELFEAQRELARARVDLGPQSVRDALEAAVGVYQRHGPVLRAVAEAAADDERIADGQARIRHRFDELLIPVLREVAADTGLPLADITETARALNLLNENYLLDSFGREPRVSPETAVQTLSEIWVAVMDRSR